jgi:hypothetical protein
MRPRVLLQHWIVVVTLVALLGAMLTALIGLLVPVPWQGINTFALASITAWFAVENWSLLQDHTSLTSSLDTILERAEARSSIAIGHLLEQNGALSAQNASLVASNVHLLTSLRCFQGLSHGILRWQMISMRLRAIQCGRITNRLAHRRLVHSCSHP